MPAVANHCPECCTCPPLFTDNFSRDDETIEDSPATDSTGHWKCEGTSSPEAKWKIESKELTIDVPSGLSSSASRPFAKVTVSEFEHAASASCKIWLPAQGASVLLELVVDVDAEHAMNAFAAFTCSAEEGSVCGTMQILDANRDPLSDEVPVDGMTIEEWHSVQICLDYDLAICVIKFNEQWHHILDFPIFEGSGLLPGVVAELWPDQGIEGKYKFDNFKIGDLRAHTAYGYDTDYSDDDNSCPECRGLECDGSVDPFDDSRIDCRWGGDRTNWDENENGLQLTGEGTLDWNGSHSGMTEEDGLEDGTIESVIVSVQSDSWGAVVTVCAGPVCATITWPSAEGAEDGTLEISTGEITSFNPGIGSIATGTAILAGDALDSVTIDDGGSGYESPPTVTFTGGGGTGAAGTAEITDGVVTGVTIDDGGSGYTEPPTVTFSGSGSAVTLYLCYDAGFVVALSGDTKLEHEPDDNDETPISGASIGGNSGDGILTFKSFEISYCPVCWEGEFESPPIPICEAISLCTSDEPPPFLVAVIRNYVDAGAPCATPTSGSFALQLVSHDPGGACYYKLPEYDIDMAIPLGSPTYFPGHVLPPRFPWETMGCDTPGPPSSFIPARMSVVVPSVVLSDPGNVAGIMSQTNAFYSSSAFGPFLIALNRSFGGTCTDDSTFPAPFGGDDCTITIEGHQ